VVGQRFECREDARGLALSLSRLGSEGRRRGLMRNRHGTRRSSMSNMETMLADTNPEPVFSAIKLPQFELERRGIVGSDIDIDIGATSSVPTQSETR
jgi:hypothetical protein